MRIQTVLNGTSACQMKLGFEDFLYSGLMRRHSKVAMCEPEDLIIDHLPRFDWNDDDELSGAFVEACEEASEYRVEKVRLDDSDLKFIRRHFFKPDRLRLVMPELTPAV